MQTIGTTALVIDRDAATCALLGELLAPEGLRVVCCTSWLDAPGMAAVASPALIFLGVTDLSPADRALIATLRAQDERRPIVLMTTSPDGWCWVRDLELAGYLAKPFDIDLPLVMVRQMLSVPHE
jgi:DNA-binding response OmpR family regulator